jgi:hypothetical protein
MSISDTRKSRGRPRIDATQLAVRMPPENLARLDSWIAGQPEPRPSRPEAIRRLVDKALARFKAISVFPFNEGEWYSVGQLRQARKAILDKALSEKEFIHAMRVNDQKLYPWAKTWMEELYPCSLLADRLAFADDVKFRWTPKGAADVEFQTEAGLIKVQCTIAYPHWPNSRGKQGGQLHYYEMIELNAKGYMFPGGGVSKPTAQDVETDHETWRVAVADAVKKKIKAHYSGCWLLIYASGSTSTLLECDFRSDIVIPATERVGADKWQEVFEGLYVLGEGPANFAEIQSQKPR